MKKFRFTVLLIGLIIMMEPLGIAAQCNEAVNKIRQDESKTEHNVSFNLDDGIFAHANLSLGEETSLLAKASAKVQPKAEQKSEDGVSLTQTQIEEMINTAALYAVRQEEQFILMNIKSSLASVKEESEALRNEKSVWIRVSAVEGGVILLGILGIALGSALNRKNK